MSLKDHIDRNINKYVIGGVLAIILSVGYYNFGPHSRRTINPKGKTIEYVLPSNFKRMISVSSGGSEGDAMITYEDLEGMLRTKEYNRMGLWETNIIWRREERAEKE